MSPVDFIYKAICGFWMVCNLGFAYKSQQLDYRKIRLLTDIKEKQEAMLRKLREMR
jgi:hypothetical protein